MLVHRSLASSSNHKSQIILEKNNVVLSDYMFIAVLNRPISKGWGGVKPTAKENLPLNSCFKYGYNGTQFLSWKVFIVLHLLVHMKSDRNNKK